MSSKSSVNARTEYLAIQQVSTGKFLPYPGAKEPFTHVEPVAPWIAAPRFFHKHRSAAIALGWWLRGRTTAVYDETGEDVALVSEPVEGREPEDFRVVTVELRWVVTAAKSPTNLAAKLTMEA